MRMYVTRTSCDGHHHCKTAEDGTPSRARNQRTVSITCVRGVVFTTVVVAYTFPLFRVGSSVGLTVASRSNALATAS